MGRNYREQISLSVRKPDNTMSETENSYDNILQIPKVNLVDDGSLKRNPT